MNKKKGAVFVAPTAALVLAIVMTAVVGSIPAIAQQADPASGAPAAAKDAATTTPISFPATQVRAGQTIYRDACSACHGDTLGGAQESPPLRGDEFEQTWFDQPVSNLYSYISSYMPLDRPGALTPEEYAAVTAFVIERNGIEATKGAADLVGDVEALTSIILPLPSK
jgi:mono/diheme cytochrome c family protein